MQYLSNSLQQKNFYIAIWRLMERIKMHRMAFPNYKRQEFEIYINNTFERLNSLYIEIENSRLEFKANLLIQSQKRWEGCDGYNYNDSRTKRFAHDAVMDVGGNDLLQDQISSKSLKIRRLKWNQLKFVTMAQERIRSKNYILETIAKKSNITYPQLNDFFKNSEVYMMVTEAGLNGMVSWDGKKIYINQSHSYENFMQVFCHGYRHAKYMNNVRPMIIGTFIKNQYLYIWRQSIVFTEDKKIQLE